jgi:hypothetical protein
MFFPDSWLKGTINGNTAIFANGQFMGEDEDGKHYMCGFDGSEFVDIEFNYNDVTNVFTLTTHRLFESAARNSRLVWGYYTSLMIPGPQIDKLVEVPEGAEIETDWILEGGYTIYEWNVIFYRNIATEVAIDGSNVYIKGLCTVFPDAWLKGTIYDNTVVFPTGQFIGQDGGIKVYVLGYDTNTYKTCDIVFSYDREAKSFTLTTPVIFFSRQQKYIDPFSYYTLLKVYEGQIPRIEVPEGLKTQTYSWTDLNDDENTHSGFYKFINIGIDGNDVYVQGLISALPEAWAKGTLNGTTLTFPQAQFLGSEDGEGGAFPWGHYLIGYNGTEMCDVTFSFDAETMTFTSNTWLIDNRNPIRINGLGDNSAVRKENVWTPFQETASKPSNPSFSNVSVAINAFVPDDGSSEYPQVDLIQVRLNIPPYDVEGKVMIPNKLFYRFYSDINGHIQPIVLDQGFYNYFLENFYYTGPALFSESISEIPYLGYSLFSEGGKLVYIFQDNVETYDRIGVQSVYYGGVEEGEPGNTSDIIWYTIDPSVVTYYGIATGIENGLRDSVKGQRDDWYTIDGQKLSGKPTKRGVYIHNGKKVVVR